MDTNPYRSPAIENDAVFFATDARKATLRELWRMTPPSVSGKLAILLVKVFRLTGPADMGYALGQLQRHDPRASELHDRFRNELGQLSAMGFFPSIGFTMPVLGNAWIGGIACLGPDSTCYCGLLQSAVVTDDTIEEDSGVSFISRNSESIWPTTNHKPQLDSPPNFHVRHSSIQDIAALYQLHCNRMAEQRGLTLRRFDKRTLWETVVDIERMVGEFNINRGVSRPITAAEMTTLMPRNERTQQSRE